MSLDPIEGQRAKRRAESEAARDSDEIWTPIAAGATAGSGGGTATLVGVTAVLANNDDDIYDGNKVLVSITVTEAGDYLVCGAMSCEPKGAGSDALYIFKNDDMAALPGCMAMHSAAMSTNVDHLSIPPCCVELAEDDVIKLVGYAYNSGTPGNGATVDGTFLTVIGPLGMTVS